MIHITPQPLLGPAVQNSESWATVGCLAGFINAPNAAGVWEAVGTWAWWMAAALDFSAGLLWAAWIWAWRLSHMSLLCGCCSPALSLAAEWHSRYGSVLVSGLGKP